MLITDLPISKVEKVESTLNQRRHWHRLLGLILLLPVCLWSLTGLVFYFKPGYGDAYAPLAVKSYPLQTPLTAAIEADWLEVRALRTILGRHLLVRTTQGWQQLDVESRDRREKPDNETLTLLIGDALSSDIHRYGKLLTWQGQQAVTTTGVHISLNWETLSLKQKGRDTRLIGRLYDIHYLRWTPSEGLNKVLALLGPLILLLAALLGLSVYRRR